MKNFLFSVEFLESCLDYLGTWMQNTKHLAAFDWVLLQKIPEWNDIDKCCRILIEKGLFDVQKHQKLFHAFDYLKNYMDQEKIDQIRNEKNDKKIKKKKFIATYWAEFFTAMENSSIDCTPLDEIVSYALSISGNLLSSLRDFKLLI